MNGAKQVRWFGDVFTRYLPKKRVGFLGKASESGSENDQRGGKAGKKSIHGC